MNRDDLAVIALGSNLGDPLQQLRQAAQGLETLGEVVARSSLYETVPVGGPSGQAVYLNAVIGLAPSAVFSDPSRLLAALLELEQTQGRVRRVRWGPRTLDLDLLLFGNQSLQTNDLVLPHPRMSERAFVLVPLCEVLPTFVHPETNAPFCDFLRELDLKGVRKTALTWS